MARSICLAALLSCLAFAAACSGRTSFPTSTSVPTVPVRVSPPARPTEVPKTTHAVDQTIALGSITPEPRATPQTAGLRTLVDASCKNDLAIFHTSQETIYAALPCDRFWDDRSKQYFVNKQVAIVLEVSTSRFRVLIQTPDGAQAEFTVQGIWVE
jgi:hypothetical protein